MTSSKLAVECFKTLFLSFKTKTLTHNNCSLNHRQYLRSLNQIKVNITLNICTILDQCFQYGNVLISKKVLLCYILHWFIFICIVLFFFALELRLWTFVGLGGNMALNPRVQARFKDENSNLSPWMYQINVSDSLSKIKLKQPSKVRRIKTYF